jgi:hypothetical protein
MLLALVLTGLAFAYARCATAAQPPLDLLQVPLVVFGVLAGGIAVWRRVVSPLAVAYLDQWSAPARRRTLLLLAAVHGLVALAVSGLLLAWFAGSRNLPGDLGGTIALWLLTAPWCAWSAWHLQRRANDGQPLPVRMETAVLVTQGGLVALLASWALYWGPELADAWDTMRLYFGALAGAAFLAAPITAAEARLRRLAVSVLIVLHFAGILMAVIGGPPGPFLMREVQHWVFRPYLDFMYLNNAYRFYSPEPSPASQLWFRVEYELDEFDQEPPLIHGATSHGIPRRKRVPEPRKKMTLAHWIKLPDMDEVGKPHYLSSLQYTRRLALTENIARSEPMPSLLAFTKDGKITQAPFVVHRLQHVPVSSSDVLLGKQKPLDPVIPYHPDPSVQNYQKPTAAGRQLLSSYARHVLSLPPPREHPGATPKSVKIYRVLHRTVSAQEMAMGADPHDWIYFVPYYQGRYDPDGNLLDPDEAFLYWVLPILRENANDPNSPLLYYVYRHSGDEKWFRQPKLK